MRGEGSERFRAFLALTSVAQAKLGDPCDFVSSGATSFSREQVLRCYESAVVEERGGQPVSLSRQVGVWNVNDPEFDSASCGQLWQPPSKRGPREKFSSTATSSRSLDR
jgi:hypothetical protein